ncbi:MAG TPA: YbjN domain-containing protein [Stellaceae bacterium]|nr:YbjN domain-containing protein [Stellaceae bacterium]
MPETTPTTIDRITADAMATIVRDAGYKAIVGKNDEGITVIESANGGWTTTIRMLGQKGDEFSSLQFILWLGDKDRSVSLAKMNDFNANWRFAKGWVNTLQPGVCLQWDVDLEGGVAPTYLAKRIAAWDLLVQAFRAYMVEQK